MIAILSLIIIAVLVLFFIDLKIGIAIYLAYSLLVPYDIPLIGGIHVSAVVPWMLIFASILHFKRKSQKVTYDVKPFLPILVLYFLLLVEVVFQDVLPISIMFTTWRRDMINFFVIPIAIYNLSKYEYSCVLYFRNSIIISTIVIIIYAIYLRGLGGINPYVFYMADLTGHEIREAQFGEQASRLMIKISSVFNHPMMFGMFLSIILVYICSLKDRINIILQCLLTIGIISCIFYCGIRTPIGALFICILSYLLLIHKVKLTIQIALAGLIGLLIINYIPELSATVNSIFEKNSSNVQGSSLELRLNQLYATFDEIGENLFFGKGYGWTSYYMSKYDSHPTLYSFESIIFMVLCNSGVIGLILWIVCLFKFFIMNPCVNKSLNIWIKILIISYLSYSLITGDYGFMRFLLIFYSLILSTDNYERINFERCTQTSCYINKQRS